MVQEERALGLHLDHSQDRGRALRVSVLVIDFRHWDITGNWKLDPEFWPDPKAMVKECDEMGVRIMISPWILVDETSENFAYMKEHGLFTGSIDGNKDTVGFDGPKTWQNAQQGNWR
ncbi:MAG: hypothetical protein QGH29_08520 [Kiritimatiellia bacterium]|jgi:alpha-D-xyloside xylohydrolase|nr:hypothetical protein [Kiritimatiellia bacterium]